MRDAQNKENTVNTNNLPKLAPLPSPRGLGVAGYFSTLGEEGWEIDVGQLYISAGIISRIGKNLQGFGNLEGFCQPTFWNVALHRVAASPLVLGYEIQQRD